MEEISIPINRSEKSSYIASTEGTFLGNEFVSSGYKANNWYGLEIECAYDPSLNTQSLANFEIRGWAVNKIKTTGMAQTSGDITGTIVMNTTNISNFNFNLANTFNNSKTSIAVNQEGFINTVSKEIENGITKKDSFGKVLETVLKVQLLVALKRVKSISYVRRLCSCKCFKRSSRFHYWHQQK